MSPSRDDRDLSMPSSPPASIVSVAAFVNGTGNASEDGASGSGGTGPVLARALESPTAGAVHRLQLLQTVRAPSQRHMHSADLVLARFAPQHTKCNAWCIQISALFREYVAGSAMTLITCGELFVRE